MADPRHQKLAQVLVHYSLGLKPQDTFLIRSSTAAVPLVREVYQEALRAGAYVTTRVRIEELIEIHLREASDEQLMYISEFDRIENEHFDAILEILSTQNTRALSNIGPRRIALRDKAFTTLYRKFSERAASGELRWCITLFPTNAYAQDADMSLSEYEDFVYGAGMLDEEKPAEAWRKVQEGQQHIADFLDQEAGRFIIGRGNINYGTIAALCRTSGVNLTINSHRVLMGRCKNREFLNRAAHQNRSFYLLYGTGCYRTM